MEGYRTLMDEDGIKQLAANMSTQIPFGHIGESR